MIAIRVVGGDDPLTSGGPAVAQIATGTEGERGHATTGEGEVIGAKIPAGFRVRLRSDAQVLRLGDASEIIFQVCAPEADELDVARGRQDNVRVEIDNRGGGGKRMQRVR